MSNSLHDNDNPNQSQKMLIAQSSPYDDKNEECLNKVQKRISEDIVLRVASKTPLETNLIMNTLKNHFIFYNLNEAELENIKNKMFFCRVGEGKTLYREGEVGTCFFILNKGSVELLVDDKFEKEIRQPEGFGEIALLYKTERISAVRTREKCQLWVIDRETFKEAVEEMIIQEYKENRKSLETSKMFSGLDNEYKDRIASAFIEKVYNKGENIIREGDPGSCFYFIKQGSASVTKGSKFLRKLTKGDTFGQQSLFYNTMRQVTINTDENTRALILGRDTLNKIMGDKIYEVTFKNLIRWAFENNSLLEKVNKQTAEALIDNMKLSYYKINETIFRRGVTGFQKVVVVIEGQLKNICNGSIVAFKGECYGEQLMLQKNKEKTLDEQIVMNSYGVLAELKDQKLIESLQLHKLDEAAPNLAASQLIRSEEETRIKSMLQNTKINQLQFIENISKSQFYEIMIVKDTFNNIFVVKAYKKMEIQDAEVEEYIINESQVLKELAHPFILNVGLTFQNESIACYLTEYVIGSDLLDVMDEIGLLSSSDAQFYTANVILILEYLANHCIICRDIKPENFMVMASGYLKLMNLSVCKKTVREPKRLAKTYTIVGTPHYIAPDVILGKGYNNMVDLWSLGVMVFEMLCGYMPFGDKLENPYEVYEAIMHEDVHFPELFTDKKAVRFVSQLLNHNPETRLNNSFENLKNNTWLNGIQWDALLEQQKVFGIPYTVLGAANRLRTLKQSRSRPLSEILRKKQPPMLHNSEIWRQFGEYVQ